MFNVSKSTTSRRFCIKSLSPKNRKVLPHLSNVPTYTAITHDTINIEHAINTTIALRTNRTQLISCDDR